MAITIESDLKEYLVKFEQKLDNLQKDVGDVKVAIARLEGELKSGMKSLEGCLKGESKSLEGELKRDIKALDAKIDGISKRLDTQEFINRSVVVGVVLALIVGVVKWLYPYFSGKF
jgi:predicted nuclease with TOPRIM domain